MHGGLPWGRENVNRPEGTQVRSIRSGMGVSIASDVKGPPPNRMADSVQAEQCAIRSPRTLPTK